MPSDFEVLSGALELRGRTVVDIGCGDGALVRRLLAAGADALGVDVSVDRARRLDPVGRYLQGGAEALPLADASVDVALLMLSLHHVPEPDAAFPELARVVREHVYIAEPLPSGDFFELLRPVDDETAVRAAAQEAIRRATGFEHVRTIEYDVSFTIPAFEAFRDRVLAADPSRTARFAELEAELRERFTPGAHRVPMRADVLRRAGA